MYTESLCRSDCLAFTNNYCREELKLLRGGDKVTMDLLMPNCDLLHDENPGCISIPRGDLGRSLCCKHEKDNKIIRYLRTTSFNCFSSFFLVNNFEKNNE